MITQIGSTQVVSTYSLTQTISKPTGTAAGDIIYAKVAWYNGTYTTPTGFTLNNTQGTSGVQQFALFERVCDGTEPASWSFTTSTVVNLVTLATWRSSNGPFTVSPFDNEIAYTQNGTAGFTVASGAMTPTSAPGFFVAWFYDIASNDTFTYNASTNPSPGIANSLGYC